MPASAKIFTPTDPTPNDDWTVVVPRRGKPRKFVPKVKTPEEQLQPWVPTDVEIDPDRESKLISRMENCIKRIESSQFYQTFVEQMQSQEVLDSFRAVLGSETNMPMVIYGIGSIDSYDPPRLQLSLAILMKRNFNWISEVEVFDPILTTTESRVLQTFGCSVLSVNEQGRRRVVKPTLFFMPHCEAYLYDNLLNTNWRAEDLNKMVLFGNSFEVYQKITELNNSTINGMANHILAIQRLATEYKIDIVSDELFAAFNYTSWHFFRLDLKSELPVISADDD
ncbi:hypothetical protein ACFE04_001692 [Oxalis oulophora]